MGEMGECNWSVREIVSIENFSFRSCVIRKISSEAASCECVTFISKCFINKSQRILIDIIREKMVGKGIKSAAIYGLF